MRALQKASLDQRDPQQALPHALEMVSIYRRNLPAGHAILAQSEGLLGSVHFALGEHDAARPLLESSLAALEKLHGPEESPATRQAIERLAALERAIGSDDAAELLEARLRVAR